MAEAPGIHLSDPSVMAKITQFLKWLFSLGPGQRLAPHTPAGCESWEQTAQRRLPLELPRSPALPWGQLTLPRDQQPALVWVLTHTIMVQAQAVGAIRKRQVKKHDSIFLVGSEGYVLLFPILRQPRAAPVLGKARPCGILDRAPDQLPRDLVSVPASPSSRPMVFNR